MSSSGEITSASSSSIAQFYAKKNVLITGVTGFVGKVLLEKLLRTCPEVGKIFLFVRPKRGQSVQERITDLIQSQLFDTIRVQRSDFGSHLHGISGDLLEPDFGMSTEDRQLLHESVHIVIHSAATVRFDEPLRLAVQMNLEASAKMLDLAKDMRQLQAYIHLSTAYANCNQDEVDEVVYAPSIQPQKLLDAISWMDEDMMNLVTKQLIHNHPNTYTFTKQLAEHLVSEYAREFRLPVVIVRPSIITSAYQEPVPGWVDNFNGPTGLITAMGKGLLRSMLGNKHAVADIVPVDMVSNLVLAAGWKLVDDQSREQRRVGEMAGDIITHHRPITVYNCTSGQVNRFTWDILERSLEDYFSKYPIRDCVRVPRAKFTTWSVWHQLQWFFNHQLPAVVLDMWMYVSGRRAIFVRVNQRIQRNIKSLYYFTTREWIFHCDNVQHLWKAMSPEDRKKFDFDITKINWHQYMHNYCAGIKQYALKEDPSEIEVARAHIKKLQRISFMVNCVLTVAVWRLLVKRVPIAHHLWTLMLNLAVRLYRCMPLLARAN